MHPMKEQLSRIKVTGKDHEACASRTIRFGTGYAAAHDGETFQIWARHNGEQKVLLNSLPCPLLSRVEVVLDDSTKDWCVFPPDRTRTLRGVIITARELGHKNGGRIFVDSTSRVGAGLGTSGCEVAGGIKGTYNASGHPLPKAESLVRLIRASGDTALDSTLLDFPCVTASRSFEIVTILPRPLPQLIGVAFDSAPDRVVVTGETYLKPPRCSTTQAKYTDVLHSFIEAVSTANVTRLGAISTACCRLGQEEVFNPLLESGINICSSEKALGMARSYTGTFLTALLAPTDPDLARKVIGLCTAFAELGAGKPFFFLTTGKEIQHVADENSLSAIGIYATSR
jgi:uncharacterized protein involved in propanediol utilization